MGKCENLKLTLDVRNLDNIKNTLKVINNSIYENNGIISEYNKKLLDNLLGTNWNKEYLFGDKYMSLEGEI
ncbi:hypothetical protein QTH11_03530 [Clostridium perfringens]|nr:hypothetical protein [Clostridium perfringens]MDM0465523.1 hypothetical protein [Clostridium perfringens]